MTDIGVASAALAGLVLLVAALLAWRESADRRTRPAALDLDPADADHFAHQDRRRAVGIVMLGLLAAGLVIGSRLPPRLGARANPPFAGIWLGVIVLLFLLLGLALRDWIALRRYAWRQRQSILRERLEILQDEIRRRKGEGSEEDPPLGDLFR